MSAVLTSKSAQRSYLGIGGCCLFAIATGCLFAVIAANWHAEYKLAGLEAIVVGPLALLLYVVGSVMGATGMRRRRENPFSLTALILNIIPIAIVPVLVIANVLITSFFSVFR
jgi:hypothetical protein